MDYDDFLKMAEDFKKLKIFPYFQIALSLMSSLSVRKDLGSDAKEFSRKHPLACWISTMLVMCSGGMIFNGLLGQAIVTPFKNTPAIIIGTIVWYLVFFAPFDIVYKVGTFFPIKFLASAMVEVIRTKRVFYAVSNVAELYPDGWAVIIAMGTLMGNGAGFIKLIERLIRGVWTPAAMEFLHPSLKTKVCLLASIIIVLTIKTDLISVPPAIVYFNIAMLLVYIKLISILMHIRDPFVPFENFFCAIFFGGISDCLALVLKRAQTTRYRNKFD